MLDRPSIIQLLKSRTWFTATEQNLQDHVLSLPESCNNFLEELAFRPEEGGGVRICNLNSILIPDLGKNNQGENIIFGLFLIFRVQNLVSNQFYTYQYFTWRQGSLSGAKGIALIEDNDGEISHIVCLRGFSFAVGAETNDCIGGFAEMNEGNVSKMLDTIHRELKEELGLAEIKPIRVLSLGRLLTDRGMTPNRPALFAVVIDGKNITALPKEDALCNTDPFEMRSKVVIVPRRSLWGAQGFILQNDDSVFHACLSRLIALGHLKPNQ